MNTETRRTATPMDSRSEPLPSDFEEQAKLRYAKMEDAEQTFAQYLQSETNEFYRLNALEKDPTLRYTPTLKPTMTPCGNGDFEQGLDEDEWQGAWGSFPINFSALTDGILSGGITDQSNGGDQSQQAHQTWVSVNPEPSDPYISTMHITAPGSSGAVRIGNAVSGKGCELLSKTFIVTPAQSTIKFWYAVVLQNPTDHTLNEQPFFWVRVTDASGNIVPDAFDFGNGLDKVIADSNNPFFQTIGSGRDKIVYKDWSCAQIDLSTQVGKQVTIEFITQDCGRGAHWGYAYIDNFCGDCAGSPTGNISYNSQASSQCGSGNLCFDYTLPTTTGPKGDIITGSVTITLNIYQNGVLLKQFPSPVLSSGSSYCFNITPSSIPGINASLGGFDFTATGDFTIGTPPIPLVKIIVNSPKEGMNNDYLIACPTASCADITSGQNAYLSNMCASKLNALPRIDCDRPDGVSNTHSDGCRWCVCDPVTFPDIKPCISVKWGDSQCDCLETNDVEVLCISVCNCYANVTFNNLSIGHIQISHLDGSPVAALPDGTPSVQLLPSGPICFGNLKPCWDGKPTCVSRELVLYTRGAVGKDYLVSLEGVCFTVSHEFQSEQCFVMNLCQD